MGAEAAGRVVAALAAAAALLAPAPATAVVGGQAETALWPHFAMVLNDRGGVCTGVVIGRQALLTAAHCVAPRGGGRAASPAVRVHWMDGARPVLVEPERVAIHPGFRSRAIEARTRSVDLAVIRLAEPLPATFEPLPLDAAPVPAPGAELRVLGFGVGAEGEARSSGTLRTAALQAVEPHGPSRVLAWAQAPAGEAGACEGDSGGALLAEGRLLAVTTWSTGRGARRCGALTQGVLLAPHLDWVRDAAR